MARMIRSVFLIFLLPVVLFSFTVVPSVKRHACYSKLTPTQKEKPHAKSLLRHAVEPTEHVWSPQDLTQDLPGYLAIPDTDYVKLYQKNPSQLWPVEFFVIVYRRLANKTQILVRKSANGTSKWGLGSGVPVTRWMLEQSAPAKGYQLSDPRVSFEARNFPEFPKAEVQTWAYDKVDLSADAFHDDPDLVDPELEAYAHEIRDACRKQLSRKEMESNGKGNSWESIRTDLIKHILDRPNSVSAIQGALRMSGVFALKESAACDEHVDDSSPCRYISLKTNPPNPEELARTMRVYTMFPQMPDPMPLPSTSPEDLQKELFTRDSRMAETGRNPHQDKYGRTYTHTSTSNVSNTIHGVYLTLDVTGLAMDDDDVPPALDLFGNKRIPREWKSLEDLRVLDAPGGYRISTEDPKPMFISGFIVRQLVQERVIKA